MFTNTIDKKSTIIDNNGNQIVDLTTTIFGREVGPISSYNTVKMTDYFLMRADKVAYNEYGTDEYAEYILKYSGISNPFSLDKDDIIIIPEQTLAAAQMVKSVDMETNLKDQVKTYYKFTNKDYKSDSTPYKALEDKVIPSGVLTPDDNAGFSVPYISDDGATAITIRNGRMYFGEDAGPSSAQQYSEAMRTALDAKCAINGMSLTDFVRASVINLKK